MTKNEKFMEFLDEMVPGAIVLGSEGHDRERLFPAIVGIDYNSSRLIYSRPKLVQCFMESDGMTEEEAEEWIDYNVDRSLPYFGPQAPIIMAQIENDFEDDEKKC